MSDRPTACVICGTTIEQRAKGPARLTCSQACRTAKWRWDHGLMTITYAVPVWDEGSRSFATRWYLDDSSGIIDGATGDGQGTTLLEAMAAPPPSAHGDHHEYVMDRAWDTVSLVLSVFDDRESQQRILTALRPWLTGIVQRGAAAQRDHLSIHRYLNPVLRDLKAQA